MSYCLINKEYFKHNIDVIAKHIDIEKIAFVLKNNAYGHGLIEMAKLANEHNIKHAVVINYNEAKEVAKLFDSILVLSDIPSQCNLKNVFIAINDFNSISKIPKGSCVELKVDTGMCRNGIQVHELDKTLKEINSCGLLLKGVFTHFANAFEGESMFKQKRLFDEVREKIITLNQYDNIRFHCSSSPGIFRMDNSEYDLARIGIALYGYVDLPKKVKYPNLKPILSLWAEKISTRNIEKGDEVGYGGVFKADSKIQISTYDIGYGDGFLRLDENKKAQISSGENILGRVSMNNLAIAGNKQKICIFTNVSELAKVHKTISYELLCRINSKIQKRVI